jgi:hypothetical protein
MALKVQKVDTWKAMLRDKPGELAAKLSALAKAGINLEFVIARRSPEKPGTGVVFVTPIEGAAKGRAAQLNGFQRTKSMHTVRIEGTDRRGEGARIAQVLAEKGVNLRGFSGASISKKFVAHLALDGAAEAAQALRVLKKL